MDFKPLEPVLGKDVDFESAIKRIEFLQPEGKMLEKHKLYKLLKLNTTNAIYIYILLKVYIVLSKAFK